MNILIADDEFYMIKIVKSYLEKEGFNVLTAQDGESALEIFYNNKIDLVILDWMMPKINGLDVCAKIKEIKNIKVLMLTAKEQNEDELLALESGADDYIKKPFDPRILILRVKKLLKIYDIIKFKNLKIDFKAKKLFKDDVDLKITKKEFELFSCLYEHKGQILSRNQLLDRIWGFDYIGDDRTVDTHIRRLREKIGVDLITTHRLLGYCLDN